MTLCRYFQAGTCRKGNSCTFEHVKSNATATAKYNETSLKTNLTEERPQWKLSVYGPAKEEPNLIVGTDKSCEEDRLLYYTSMRTTGNESQYIASHEQSFNQMETQVNAILNNPTAAIQHYEKEKSNHAGPFGGSASNAPFAPFTGNGAAFGGAFGQQQTSAFGASAFGQPSAFGTTAKPASAFGQPSSFGTTAKPVSAFGQPSAFGSTSSLGGGGSAFGSTSALGGNNGSAFGSTNTLGGSGSAFGSTSTLGAGGGSAFGSTNALGGSSGSAFGSTSALGGGGSAFGSTSALGSSGSAFGSTSGGSAFGQPSAFGAMAAKPATTTAFGAPSNTASAFGSTSTLGGGGAFGTAAPTSAFGSTSNLGSTAFGTPSTGSNTSTNAFGTTNSNVPANMQSGNEVSNNSPEWQAFAASEFTYRSIPEVEPPIQLR